MKCFSNIRTKRSTAFVVLLVWLFTLASGVANACPSQSPESFRHGSAVTQASAMETASGMSGDHGKSFASFDDHSGTSEASCLEVFDGSAQALPKQRTAFDLSDTGLVPFMALVWSVAAASVVSAHNRVGALQPPASRQAIRVRFSRLAL